ncbi:MAG TPA: class I SAM-dependent rRNA methyltransferase [Candidatus Paceibacterota bacterium]|nr:class I SAM-dependent rRNA methyltransferase [Verrucomicrobiota bacterium]HSA01258.1 class I SAM-dependent rRNA methyltransferase [Candidatus Paceibacterota bacterium]
MTYNTEMDNAMPTVVLRPGETERIIAGHPWIYAASIEKAAEAIADGDVVEVWDRRHRFWGIGFYNSHSKIRVRLLARDRVAVDGTFFENRIRSALAIRTRYLPGATSFRAVNAESDFLSGLIVDKYEDVLVIQTSALGMDRRKSMIVSVLEKIFSPRVILERNDMASRKFEGLPDSHEVWRGPLEGPVPVTINGLRFEVDLREGHKTGFYLDQQLNYRRVAEYARGARVLDCFCFQGGFALHAARGGALSVHGIDQSPEAVAASTENARRNELASVCSFEAANVFDWLKAHTASGPREKVVPQFDLIILDPPSFTRNRASVPDALRGYKEIHLRALKLLRPNGILATFCCSHHVDAVTFHQIILEAAFDAHKILRRVATFSQSPDHPIIPSIPETEYLKGFAFELV